VYQLIGGLTPLVYRHG